MEHYKGCLICGKELIYTQNAVDATCSLCGRQKSTNAACAKGHYICDTCHGLSALDYIETFCLASESTDPVELATTLMRDSRIKMHGPEHHFLVPAVLLTTYYNKIGNADLKAEKLSQAKERSKNVLGGFCGLYGNCGAGVGTGIFMSLLTDATPLSKESWRLSNRMTATSLMAISDHNGPRCCKRDVYLALESAIRFVQESHGVQLTNTEPVSCEFSAHNSQCIGDDCPYHRHLDIGQNLL